MGRITMRHVALFLLTLTLSSFSLAEFEIPNEFEDGQVTSASQMNENFQALKAEIEMLRGQLEFRKETQKTTFVGVTDAKFDGAGGLLAMGQACDAMVSGSFFCSSLDYHTSHKPNDITITSDAWVNYLPDQPTYDSYNLGQQCFGWKNNSDRGVNSSVHYINHDGNLSRDGNCINQKSVACCK